MNDIHQFRRILNDCTPAGATARLKALHHYATYVEQSGSGQRRELINLIARIRELAEGGKILLVESGRDCDGVQYWGRVRVIDATLKAYEAAVDEIHYWADGPCWFDLERVSARHAIERGSRDLTLEAFENGHSHVLRS